MGSFIEDMASLWRHAKEEDVDMMRDRIESAIAMTSIATQDAVSWAYDQLGSWDDVVQAARETSMGYTMTECVDRVLEERLVYDKMAAAGISGARAGRNLRILVHLMDLYAKLAEDADSGAAL